MSKRLLKEFLEPLGVSQVEAAKRMRRGGLISQSIAGFVPRIPVDRRHTRGAASRDLDANRRCWPH